VKWPVYIVLTAVLCAVFTIQGLPLVALNNTGREADDWDLQVIPSATVESITRLIEEDASVPQPAPRLSRLHMLRGSLWLQQHEPQKALADFDAALEINPGEAGVRFGRAECFRQLGDLARADAEMRAAGLLEINPVELFPLNLFHLMDGDWAGSISVSSSRAWLITGVAWVFLTIVNVAIGWAPMVEGSGSRRRLVQVACGLGILQVLPLAIWGMLVACQGAGHVQGILAAGMTVFSLICTIPFMQPPIRLRGTAEKLPRVEDQAFLNRVAELAQKMSVPIPLVRLWPSISGSQQALAYAGTLPAPQLVVTDGILRRLSPVERDAVVAHELGHIANGSLWFLAAVIPISCTVATAATAFLPLTVAIPFGLALAVGLRRVVSRPLELDCDLRAARTIGFRETAGALTKIHAVHSFGDAGLLPLLVYATATHPSRAIRLSALESAAPAENSLVLSLCARTVRRHRLASVTALSLWLLILTGTLAASAAAPPAAYLAVPLWIAGLAPLTIQALARWKQVSRMQQRMGFNRARMVFIALSAVAGLALLAFPGAFTALGALAGWPEESPFVLLSPLILAILGLAGGGWMKRNQETRKLRAAVAVAFQVHDFDRVLKLAASAPTEFARDHVLRYNVALARAIIEDRETAITELERLFRDHPRFFLSGLTLSLLLLDADRPGRALEIARRVVERLPRDAGGHLLEARALRRLERLDEAQDACERALELEPGDGMCHAVAAAVALECGEFSRAQELIDTALELSPGEAYALLVRAEIVLQTQPFEDPRPAIDEALAAIRGNPLVFLTADAARLERLRAAAYPDEAELEVVIGTA
jgi:tetratricopeptide (TPR) repeat protein